jgi:CHAT domain-containing protein/tetratricopeptide (TPR) repeat protein
MKNKNLRRRLGCWLVPALFLILPHGSYGQDDIGSIESLRVSTRECWEKDIGCQTDSIENDTPKRYRIDLEKDEYFQTRVDQKDFDVILTLRKAGVGVVASMDGHRRTSGIETLTYVAAEPGAYILEISRADSNKTGSYTIKRDVSRRARARDRMRVGVEKTFTDALTARKTGDTSGAVEMFTKAIAGWQKLNDRYMIRLTRETILTTRAKALFLKGQSEMRKNAPTSYPVAIKYFLEAADLFDRGGERWNVAGAYVGAGTSAQLVGELLFDKDSKRAAVRYLVKASDIFKSVADTTNEYLLMVELTSIAIQLEDKDAVLKYSSRALGFYGANTWNCAAKGIEATVGAAMFSLGDWARAHEFLINRVKVFYDKYPGLCQGLDKAAALSNMGVLHLYNGEYAQSVEAYKQSLIVADLIDAAPDNLEGEKRKIGVQAGASLNMGLALYAQSRVRKLFDPDADPSLLNYTSALETFDRILATIGDNSDSALMLRSSALAGKGLVYFALERYEEAIDLMLNHALPAKRSINDPTGEANVLEYAGEIYLAQGKMDEAARYFAASAASFEALDDPRGTATALFGLMRTAKETNPGAAIFYGKMAANKFQDVRTAFGIKDGQIQRSYFRTHSSFYETLTELLIGQKRFDEAVQIIEIQRDPNFQLNLPSRKAGLTPLEQKSALRINAASGRLRREFLEKAAVQRTPLQTPSIKKTLGNFSGLLRSFETFSSEPPGRQTRAAAGGIGADIHGSIRILDRQRQKKHAFIYTIASEDRLYLLLFACENAGASDRCALNEEPQLFVARVGKARMSSLVSTFLAGMRRYNTKIYGEPYKPANDLYRAIFGALSASGDGITLESKLQKLDAKVLYWSLDGNLRYVPMAALYDNEQHFVLEKYETAVITGYDKAKFTRPPRALTACNGYGKSTNSPGFTALTNVEDEAKTICTPDSELIRGKFYLNDKFDLREMEALNRGPKPSLIHFATHFRFVAGNAQGSFLLLGDGNKLRLYDMQKLPTLFAGVELVTAAACETAVFKPDHEGREIEAFAEMAQKLGANSVLGTLWSVDDYGTSQLTMEFYRLYKQRITDQPGRIPPKSEILREAQLKLLRSGRKVGDNCGDRPRNQSPEDDPMASDPGSEETFDFNPARPCEHPYFWAPFVLYGNSR